MGRARFEGLDRKQPAPSATAPNFRGIDYTVTELLEHQSAPSRNRMSGARTDCHGSDGRSAAPDLSLTSTLEHVVASRGADRESAQAIIPCLVNKVRC